MSLTAVPTNASMSRAAASPPPSASPRPSDYGVLASASGIRHAYPNGPEVLCGIDLEVLPGHFTALIGPSGSGKSTLMRIFNGLVRPTEGTVVVAGVDLTCCRPTAIRAVRRSVGMVFQQFNLVRRLTALENVLVGRLGYLPVWRSTIRRYPRADVEIAVRALSRVGMDAYAWRRADSLSGGQQQRVGIARALAQQPRFILADEPIASLDPRSAEDVMRLLHDIHEQDGIPVLLSLHQLDAAGYADRIVGLRRGEIVFRGMPAALTDAVIQRIYYEDGASRTDGVRD
jgi:phosphonate transport system ATP-binding protein